MPTEGKHLFTDLNQNAGGWDVDLIVLVLIIAFLFTSGYNILASLQFFLPFYQGFCCKSDGFKEKYLSHDMAVIQ